MRSVIWEMYWIVRLGLKKQCEQEYIGGVEKMERYGKFDNK